MRADLVVSVVLGFLFGSSFSLPALPLLPDTFLFLQLGLLFVPLSLLLLLTSDALFVDTLIIFLGLPPDAFNFFLPLALFLFPDADLLLAPVPLITLGLFEVPLFGLLLVLDDLGFLRDVPLVLRPLILAVSFLILALYPLLVPQSPDSLLLKSLLL